MREVTTSSRQHERTQNKIHFASYPSNRELKREVSVRTLFIRNVDYAITEEDILTCFSKFGEVKRSFFLIEKRGIAFVTYFDIRCAEKAIKELKNYKLGKRILEVHYSVPKGNTNQNRCSEDDNQATLFLTLSENLTIDIVVKQFAQFGELLGVRNLKEGTRHKFVEYFDSRHALAAVEACKLGMQIDGVEISAELSWDIGAKNLVKQEREREHTDRTHKPRSPVDSQFSNNHYSPPTNAASSATVPSSLALQAILSAASPPQQQIQQPVNSQNQWNQLNALLQSQQQPQQPVLNSNTNQQLQILQQLYALQNQLNANKK